MATELLAFVEHVERAKLDAQDAADRVAKEIDFEALQADPNGEAERIIIMVIAALDPILDELAVDLHDDLVAMGFNPESVDLDTAVQNAKDEVERSAIRSVERYLEELDVRVAALADSIGEEAAQDTLKPGTAFVAAAIAGLAGVLDDAATGAVSTVSTEVRDEFYAAHGDQEARWATVQDKNVCEGSLAEACRPRHGQVKTLSQWTALGLPKAPNLICCVYHPETRPCRCLLVPTTYALGNEPVSAAETIARIRDERKR